MKKNNTIIQKMTIIWDAKKNWEEFGITFEDIQKSKDRKPYYWTCPLEGCSFINDTLTMYKNDWIRMYKI